MRIALRALSFYCLKNCQLRSASHLSQALNRLRERAHAIALVLPSG